MTYDENVLFRIADIVDTINLDQTNLGLDTQEELEALLNEVFHRDIGECAQS